MLISQKKLQKIWKTLIDNKWLILLLLFAFSVRFLQPYLQLTPFLFDQGRDAIDVFRMLQTWKPTLIGPWTSIPGLYFGPGWYYLLLPVFIISNGHPVAPVWLMVFLLILQIFLAWKYLGKIEAVIIASAPLWLIISSGAWNPYPMTLTSIIILICLKRIAEKKKLEPNIAFVIGVAASLGFHFSTAFAIWYFPIIFISFFSRKMKLSAIAIRNFLIGAILPFIPQIIFEFRHYFSQTRGVLRYLLGERSDSVPKNWETLSRILHTTVGEFKIGTLPEVWLNNDRAQVLITYLALLIIGYGAFISIRKRNFPILLREYLLFIILPLCGFFLLHFNVWYVLGMMPVGVLIVAHAIRHLPKPLQYLMVIGYLITPLSLNLRLLSELPELKQNPALLSIQKETLQYVREQSQGQAFSSYHYRGDIYDFNYQYLYMWQAKNGLPLPVEFSYQPGEHIYIKEKAAMIKSLPAFEVEQPTKLFFIIERPANEEFLGNWWGRQIPHQNISSQYFGEHIEVIEGLKER